MEQSRYRDPDGKAIPCDSPRYDSSYAQCLLCDHYLLSTLGGIGKESSDCSSGARPAFLAYSDRLFREDSRLHPLALGVSLFCWL